MTKTVRFGAEGGPEVLELVDVEIGEPGPGEVRIDVEAIGLNRAEAMFRAGIYFERPNEFPATLGYSACGVIDQVGPGVTEFKPGDPVSTVAGFSMRDYGVYGEQATVPAAAVLRHPEGLSAAETVALWGPFTTAYGAIVDEGGVRPGDAVLITAASSSVGLAAIDVVNHIGAVSIAATRTAAKRDRLVAAGAAHVIVTDNEDITARTLELLLAHPDQLDRLKGAPEGWPGAIEEVLRYDSPVQITLRTPRVATEINGTTIPAGRPVVIALGGANRDPDTFPDPHLFDSTRRNAREHLAFSSGPHFCLGAQLARLEAATATRALFDRFPELRLDGQPTRRGTRILRGFEHLPVTPVPATAGFSYEPSGH